MVNYLLCKMKIHLFIKKDKKCHFSKDKKQNNIKVLRNSLKNLRTHFLLVKHLINNQNNIA